MKEPSAATSGYLATDRCLVGVEVKRDTFVPCKLKCGHEGDHEPAEFGEQTTSASDAAYRHAR